MVEIEDLGFGYPGLPPLFSGLNLKIGSGEPWTIIGPSGCGKTTLLHLLAGLKKGSQGSIAIDGVPISRPGSETGLILQDHGLLPWATVYKNITLGFRIRKFYGPDGKHSPVTYRFDREKERTAVDYWMRKLGIAELKGRFPSALSGGQRQRVAIARTLVLNPKLLLMDEPFSSLDAVTKNDMQTLTKSLSEETGHTRVLVTHDIDEAVLMGAKILVFRKGGTLAEVNNPVFGVSPGEKSFQAFAGEIKAMMRDEP